ncbi:MAG: hypothetical protein HY696_07145 [Deltaproteobacteria bacterium]|nr:hypothetical protein [Deltaproteobacteria bacterium]
MKSLPCVRRSPTGDPCTLHRAALPLHAVQRETMGSLARLLRGQCPEGTIVYAEVARHCDAAAEQMRTAATVLSYVPRTDDLRRMLHGLYLVFIRTAGIADLIVHDEYTAESLEARSLRMTGCPHEAPFLDDFTPDRAQLVRFFAAASHISRLHPRALETHSAGLHWPEGTEGYDYDLLGQYRIIGVLFAGGVVEGVVPMPPLQHFLADALREFHETPCSTSRVV